MTHTRGIMSLTNRSYKMDKKCFGKQLQKYRERAGYSQEKLAEKIDCSTIFISYIERGVKSPGLDTLIRLANALDISVDLLLGSELLSYNFTKLRDIEKRIQMLPELEQLKLLDILDSIISVELKYNQSERLDK